MTDQFRAMCAELVELCTPVDSIPQLAERLQKLSELADRARALLAEADGPAVPDGREPASVALQPSDGELDELAWTWYSKTSSTWYQIEAFRAYARAVLARWGRPAAAPVPETGEVAELVAELNRIAADAREARQITDARALTRAADLLQRQYPQPVAVSERWPEFSDCDPQERVWAWNPVLDHWKLSRINRSVHTHWLSAHALPTPEATND